MVSFKGAHFAKDVILTCVQWSVAYPLSYRQREELMQERGVAVDHATINRWILKYSPQEEGTKGLTPAEQFYALAASLPNLTTSLGHHAKIVTKPTIECRQGSQGERHQPLGRPHDASSFRHASQVHPEWPKISNHTSSLVSTSLLRLYILQGGLTGEDAVSLLGGPVPTHGRTAER